MRFQTTDQVPCEDAELVLAVLEDRLHTLAHEVVREGRRITLFGLGPSPRVVNLHDKTMIDVSAVDGVTKIDADVTFQASAILGEAPQDKIVLGKLESVFEEIKAELGLQTRRDTVKVAPLPQKTIPVESAMVEGAVVVASASEGSGIAEATVETPAEADVLRSVVEEPRAAETEQLPLEVPVASVDERPVEAVPTAAAAPIRIVFADTERIVVSEPPVPVQAEMRGEAERWEADALLGIDEKEQGGWRRAGSAVAAVCLVAMVILVARDLMNMGKTKDREAEPVAIAATAPAPAAAPIATTAPISVPKPPLPGQAEDPAEMVKQWESAMQSRDAAGQAAFYADTVSRYFLRNKVGKDAVLADKQAAIDNRKVGWTFKVERVKVQRSGDSAATITMVKHFNVEKDGATVSEWFIPSQLKLKREDGRWRIVSERDLGWANSIDDLDG